MKRAALLPLLLLAACRPAPATLEAHEGWLRAGPAEGPLAGYVRLHNGTRADLRCDGAESADFGAIEIHRSMVHDGMSHMMRDQVVEIPAGGRAELAPGGLHLMLFRPQRALQAGDRSRITLRCGEQRVTADFVVRSE